MLAVRRIVGVLLAAVAAACGCASEPGSTPRPDAGAMDAGSMDAGDGGGDAGVCEPGTMEPCYTGPAGMLGIGACTGGLKICNPEGTGFGDCAGEVLPAAEDCATPVDDDCDGQVNEADEGCACDPGSMMPCYSGPAGSEGIGICHGGMKICNPDGLGYGACMGEALPAVEDCAAPEDEDCDGQPNQADDDCVCTPGSTKSCYTGPPSTEGTGICHGGTKICNPDGLGYGACNGEVTPALETCNTLDDDDCDTLVNEEGDGCVCFPGVATDCYSGPPGTDGVGICHSGSKVCNAAGTAYGNCVGEVVPAPETCNTPDDDNCNGLINEGGPGCVCFPGTYASCPYTGPAGTENKGICHSGAKICNPQGTGYSACTGEVLPEMETCNAPTMLPEDEDCDGQYNEGVCAVVAIAAGGQHSLALRSDGTVWSWGGDWAGQLGDSETLASQPAPVQVVNMTLATAVAAGRDHSMALRLGGAVWTWGMNNSGQLGYETEVPPFVGYNPLPAGLVNFTAAAIAAGQAHSMARRADGRVWAWGSNASGQLGNGKLGGSSVMPVEVLNLSSITAIAAGANHGMALRSNGLLFTWGQNFFGQLGDGTFMDQTIAAAVPGLSSVTAMRGNNHSLALLADDTLRAWGDNWAGQLGDGSTATRTTPAPVTGLMNVTTVAAGFAHSLAVTAGGFVWAWGSNLSGQLGDGTNMDHLTPAMIPSLVNVIAVSAGSAHSLALRSEGTVWAWGSNESGQLGDGTYMDRNKPVQVLIP